MRTNVIGVVLMIGSVVLFVVQIMSSISAHNEYNNKHGNYWNLSDRSSTIEEKSLYIDKFVKSFEGSNLKGTHSAFFYKNPSNSFDANYKALISLRDRLNEIKKMDISSFEYQTAIQQITSQEQGEADEMLSVLSGCWFKKYHVMLRSVVPVGIFIVLFVAFCVGLNFVLD